MRVDQITVNPFEFVTIKACEIKHSIGEHSTAIISGYINSNQKDTYSALIVGEIEVVIGANNGDELFKGIIVDASIVGSGDDNYVLNLNLASYSYLMDITPKTRIFHQPEDTFDDLLEHIQNTYSDSGFIMSIAKGEPINHVITQYLETDWEFTKRLCSMFNATITPAYLFSGERYYFGIPSYGKNVNIAIDKITLTKAVGEHTHKIKKGVDDISEQDDIYYKITSREFARIADKIFIEEIGETLIIHDVCSYIDGEQLVNLYSCKPENGFKVPQIYNTNIIGASLEGKITDVKQDAVKIFVDLSDTKQETSKCIWLPYSTVYSSPDGTGWYAMPEIGDTIRVYFPSEKEEQSYIISATHLESYDEELRSNPDNKSIRSKYKKEVEFTPTTIRVSNNDGMEILIDDAEGISIVSNKKITFASDEMVSFSSINADLQVLAKDNVSIVQGETSVVLEENVGMAGAQVHVQK